ncbi:MULTISPECIES: O-antigen ligase family protein [Halobacterium]|nr:MULTISPECIES: O-antigen ligase family protein [Halobacterium]MCF2164671.1 O-antigen ligase family protein [Halobacterium salinarum]MCF2166883.1 O-antigen ligase family protein [Halobacterium salinarum]QRY22777.1 O-antigen ligase family protein [Halobacterium sp. GSL-19]
METHKFTGRDLALLLPLFLILIAATLQRSTAGLTLLELGLLVGIPGLGVWTFLIWRWTSSGTKAIIPRSVVWLLLIGVWSIGSIFPAIANGVDVISWGRRLFPIIVLVTVTLITFFTIRSRGHLTFLYLSLVGIEIIAVLIPLLGLASIDISTISNLQYLRDFGRGQHAGFLMALLLPAFVGYQRLNRVQQTAAVIGFVISGVGLFISFSRTMWIATAAAIGFTTVVCLHQHRLSLETLIFGTLGALFATTFTSLVTPGRLLIFLVERMRSIPNALQNASFRDRVFELQGLLTDAVTNPLMLFVGHGWGAEYTFYSVNRYSWGGIGWTSNAYSHNYYAYLLWSVGVVGLIFFVFYWKLVFRDALRVLLNDELDRDGLYLLGCMATTVSLLVSSLTAPLLNDVKWCVIFGVISGILIYIVHDRPNENAIIDN